MEEEFKFYWENHAEWTEIERGFLPTPVILIRREHTIPKSRIKVGLKFNLCVLRFSYANILNFSSRPYVLYEIQMLQYISQAWQLKPHFAHTAYLYFHTVLTINDNYLTNSVVLEWQYVCSDVYKSFLIALIFNLEILEVSNITISIFHDFVHS
jgi:hypothetical protein